MPDFLRINLYGSFRIVAPDGRDLTPPGQKARALVALLVTATNARRGRRWIEARLWSDRSPEQASGSLRQTLLELRKALGEYADRIEADRSSIWIDPERISIDLDRPEETHAAGGSFLEDVDVRDEGFEDWLRERRGAPSEAPLGALIHPMSVSRPSPTAASGFTLRTTLPQSGSTSERLVARIIADQMASGLGERLAAIRFAESGSRASDRFADLEIRCDLAEGEGEAVVLLQVLDGVEGRIVHSGHQRIAGRASDAISADVIQGMVHNALSGVTRQLPHMLDPSRPEVVAVKHFNDGVDALARFDAAGFEDASSRFQLANEADGNGVYLAWQAFVRMAQLLEHAGGDPTARMEEIEALVPQTLERAPNNGLAVALIALTRIMLEDDLGEPANLAAQALRWNQSNLFARQTLAVAYGATGDTDRAYRLSQSCQRSRPDDELGHLWELYHSLVCISAGRLDEARGAAERSSRRSPTFLAPRRQLVALCAHAGDLEAAMSYLSELRALEADFTLDRYLRDPEYPVLTLRKAGLLEPLEAQLPSRRQQEK